MTESVVLPPISGMQHMPKFDPSILPIKRPRFDWLFWASVVSTPFLFAVFFYTLD